MKSGRILVVGAWSIAILLTLLTVLYRKASTRGGIEPSIISNGPTGAAVFADLVAQAGYKIRIDGRRYPTFAPGEIPITMLPLDAELDPTTLFPDRPIQFQIQWIVDRRLGETYQVSTERPPLDVAQDDPSLKRNWKLTALPGGVTLNNPAVKPFWTADGKDLAVLASTEGGVAVVLLDPTPVLNRYVDQADNGQATINLIRRFAPAGSTLVFCEHFIGNSEADSLMRGIGPWAQAASWQGFLLFGVIAWTFAVPFGRPLVMRLSERGARDLMEAMGTAMRRGKQLGTAQEFMQREADVRLRKLARVSRREAMTEVFRRLDSRLREPYERAFLDAPGDESTTRIRDFFYLLKELETTRRKRVSSNDA